MKNRGQNVCEFFSVRKSPSKKTKNRENTKIVQRNTKKVNFPHEKQKNKKTWLCSPQTLGEGTPEAWECENQ